MSKLSSVTATQKYFMQRFQADTLQAAVERAARLEMSDSLFEEHYSLPIDVEGIAKRKSIRISQTFDAFTCHDAKLVPEKSGFRLQMRAQSGALRKRVTLAHEVGHTLFYEDHGNKPRHSIGILDAQEIQAEERICDLFAGALLMPGPQFREIISPIPARKPFSVLLIMDRAAKKFEVSLPALIVRLSDLRLHAPPYLILALKYNENRFTGGDPQLRVESCASVGSARDHYIWRNRSAVGANLNSAVRLFEGWQDRLSAGIDSAGKYAWNESKGLVDLKEGSDCFIDETIEVSIFRKGFWRRNRIEMKVFSCLYAKRNAGLRDATVVSILAPKEN